MQHCLYVREGIPRHQSGSKLWHSHMTSSPQECDSTSVLTNQISALHGQSACIIAQEPRIRPKFTRPFPSLRVGSGDKTISLAAWKSGQCWSWLTIIITILCVKFSQRLTVSCLQCNYYKYNTGWQGQGQGGGTCPWSCPPWICPCSNLNQLQYCPEVQTRNHLCET